MIARLACALLCAGLAGCSFMGLGEYDLPACDPDDPDPDDPCAKLNAMLPADQCREYQCSTDGYGCELGPRDRDGDEHPDREVCDGEPELPALDCDDGNFERNPERDEICDGLDNDCDGWVDEDVVPRVAGLQKTDVMMQSRVSMSRAGPDRLYLAVTQSVLLVDHETRLLELTSAGWTDDRDEVLAGGATCALGGVSDTCNFIDLAIAAAVEPELLLAAGIHSSGCASGLLSAAVHARADAPLPLGTPPEESNLRDGVDTALDEGDVATGEAACTRSGACTGVESPVLALLPGTEESAAQGLLLWLAPEVDRDCKAEPRCNECVRSDAKHLAALGLVVEGRPASGLYLTGSSDGRSEQLGVSTQDPPALVAWPGPDDEAGHFIAYATPDSTIELRFSPRLTASDAQLTPDLLAGRLDADAPPRSVALALDPEADPEPRGLAAAWREESDEGSAIVVAPLTFDRAAEPPFAPAGDRIVIKTARPVTEGPQLAYSRSGFAVEQPQNRSGGWLVTWIEGDPDGADETLMAARIAESEGHRMGEALDVAHGDLRELSAAAPFEGEQPGFRVGYLHERALHVDRLHCDSRPP